LMPVNWWTCPYSDGVMLENPDEIGPNFVLLLILAEKLQRLRDIFEAAEVRRMQEDKLPL
ncbi:hypothetical protein NA019_003440, partial [Salmonella enterica]|nr:hypothetical protein [Salmonella enterica subsp. diarizonae serovar 50:r:z]EEO7095579.1 hypothetical protein [Salmonella enterica]EKN5804782.1 hypothetical protein [Salmonella enterica subsp. enterica]EEJ5111929.1 hypothetical protein [Salmonella enterica subsp. diarizonae serovar 50:r:z]EGL6663511.1 hypothetical protein [Salmonella enterica]